MQVLQGTKREITIMQWKEQVKKYAKRASDSAECFNLYGQVDDLNMLIEDCEKLIASAKNAKEAIEFMDKNGIK